jgi:hypothetical protein
MACRPRLTDQIIAYFKRQAEADPYTLLQPLPVGEAGAQYQIYKGLNLESALYLASLTGSIIHVDTDAHWEQLLKDAQPAGAPSQRAWEPVQRALSEISFPVELDPRRMAERLARGDRPPIRSLLRRLFESVSSPGSVPPPTEIAKQLCQVRGKVERTEKRAVGSTRLPAHLELHVPPAGFGRHEVLRLLMMFAGASHPRSAPYALRLVFDEPQNGSGDVPEQQVRLGREEPVAVVERRNPDRVAKLPTPVDRREKRSGHLGPLMSCVRYSTKPPFRHLAPGDCCQSLAVGRLRPRSTARKASLAADA